MNLQTEIQQLDAEIRQLEKLVHNEGVAVRRSGSAPLLVSAVLATIILVFLVINYVWFSSQLTPQKLTASLEKELVEVSPAAMRQVTILGQDLLPVYADEWKKQMQAAWPQVAAKLEAEVVHLGDDVLFAVHRTLAETEARVLAETEKSIHAAYPDLNDPSQREEIAARLHAACDEALAKSLGDFDALFSKDVRKIEDLLLRFDVTDTNESTVDLQKKAIHLWLQLLDQEIMEL